MHFEFEIQGRITVVLNLRCFEEGKGVCRRKARKNVEGKLHFIGAKFAIPVKGFVN